MITINVDTGKINKDLLVSAKGKEFLDIVLFETPDSAYGNDYVAVQGVTKEQRNAGTKGPIIGNAKIFRSRKEDSKQPEKDPAITKAVGEFKDNNPEKDDVPF